MTSVKPATAKEFREWSTADTCGVLDKNLEPWYQNTQNNLFTQVRDSEFLSSTRRLFDAAATQYAVALDGASLFGVERRVEADISWYRKGCDSFVEKLYRLNVVENDEFPAAPTDDGWITPTSALRFGAVDDVVRTTLVVAYADGPSFLSAHLKKAAETAGHACIVKDHSKEKGYYAHHVYIGVPVEVAELSSSEYRKIAVPVEIQITTELQAVLREVTHRLYESERLSGGLVDGWKEDFDSGRFRAAYMAHSLRFIEAMIVDLRRATLGAGESE